MAKEFDPIGLEVLKNSLEAIADGMGVTIFQASRSPIVRNALDFSTAVLTPEGELAGQGVSLPIHLAGMTHALHACLDRYTGQIYPGDILINNDPYEGGSHLPDIFLFKPVFMGDVLVAFLSTSAHHADIGGRVPGGSACDSTEIYQEGLRIPPLRLYQRGEPNETLFRILEKAVRVPEMVLGDVQGQVTALRWGEREFLSLVKEMGLEEYQQGVHQLFTYTEELTRKLIRSLPEGQWTFTDYVDDDGFDSEPIPIVVTLTKEEDRISVDFTGTGPQCKGALNIPFGTTQGMVYAAVKSVLGSLGVEIPNAAGYFRPVTVTAPQGSFVNPLLPAPVAARGLGCVRIFQTVLGAFAQMLPQKIPAASGGSECACYVAGYDKTKTPWRAWVMLEAMSEVSWGGCATRDGNDALNFLVTNPAVVPAEIVDVQLPFRIEESGLLPDSEGPGRFRGGLGMFRTHRYLQDETLIQMRSDRHVHQPYGLWGGKSASPGSTVIYSGGERRPMPAKFLATVNSGDAMRIEVPGGGGYGDPLERDPERVLEDVIEEKVSQQRARDVYGVVVDMEHRTIDWEATQYLRQQRRA